MAYDLNIWFAGIIFIVLAGVLLYIWLQKFEIALLFFAITPLISPMFYDNLPETGMIVMEASTGPGGYIRGAILIVLGLVGIIKYLRNLSKSEGKISTQLFLLGIFILLAFGTAFYSLDQKFTLVRSTLLFSVLGFLIGFHSWLQEEGNLKKALNILFILITSIVIITFLSMFVIPARVWWWKANRFIGLWEHPNNFGAFCMLVYPILIWKFYNIKKSKKLLIFIPLFINIFLHILSGSRTTLLTSFIGIVLWLVLERSWIKLIFITLFLGFSVIILVEYSPFSFERQENSKITDLSSRENIWQSAMIFIKDSPVLGYGFGVEGKIFQDERKLDLEGSFIERNVRQSLHNGYLSIIVGVGFIGFILWLSTLLFPIWIGLSSPFSSLKAYSIVTMVMVLITNFVESALTGYSLATDIYFWIAWIIAGNIWLAFDDETQLKPITE